MDSRLGIETPKVAEFTFLRKDRVKTKSFASGFPHVDLKNDPYL